MDTMKTVNGHKWKTLDLTYIALCIALMAICAWITIPSAMPFTLQLFGVFATLGLLGGKRGTIAIGVYLLAGGIGLPLFSGFRGGFGHLLGTTGGYLTGYLVAAFFYWFATNVFGKKILPQAVIMTLGLIICYVFGTAWFIIVYGNVNGPISVSAALGMCVIPFIIPDLLKIALALIISNRVGRYVK